MSVDDSLKSRVKERYGRAAVEARAGESATSCCGSPVEAVAAPGAIAALGTAPSGCGCGCGAAADPITGNLYAAEETAGLPPAALRASLGCGNPTALAALAPGEVVLDLGSGGGIDVLLSARRVGPTGKAYGLDMTDEMLALARENQRYAGVANVEFLRGEIEDIPLPDGSVDVIISNCVINLSGDKRRVLSEAFRVLRPGGRFAVSDVVVRGELPAELRRSMELWVGCVAGALAEAEWLRLLAETGFEDPEIEPTRVYRFEDARDFLAASGLDADALAPQVEGRVMGAFVRARKPPAAIATALRP
jgi:arsenite methyltransferase